MGFATVYCDKCGAQILGAELEKGSAVSRGEKFFCSECAPSLPPESAIAHADRKGSTRFRKSGAEPQRNTDIIRNLQSMGGTSTRVGTSRIAPAPAPVTPEGSSAGVKAGIALGGVAVLVVVFVVMSQMGGSGGGHKVDNGKAKAAYDAAVALKGSRDVRGFVDAAREAKRQAAGTEFAGPAGDLAREAEKAFEAHEKKEKLATELKGLSTEARMVDDPLAYEGQFRDFNVKARPVAPEIADEAQAAWADIVGLALIRMVSKIDVSMCASAAGFRRAKEDMGEVETKIKAAGPAGKNAAEALQKKRHEAETKFTESATKEYESLEKRVQQMLADGKLEDADRAVTMFVGDYQGTELGEKAKELSKQVAAKKKAMEDAWLTPTQADWKLDVGDMKVTWKGTEISFVQEGPDGPSVDTDTDRSRRITLSKADSSWTDYDMDFDVLIEKHGGSIVLRAQGDLSKSHIMNFIPPNAQGQGLPLNTWIKIGIKLIGNQLQYNVNGGPWQGMASPSGSGGIMFVGYKGSKFKIRNYRVRRLK